MASVRRAAVASLLRSGFPGLRAVVERIKRNYPPDVGSLALDVVCAEHKPDRKMATSVLAAAWETRMSQVRVRALRCAEALHRSNPRLTIWLADRASLDSNTSVRRAAAASVALAVERLGSRAARLPRFYLRDDDPTVRVAVLEALAERLPSKAEFLLRVVEPATRSGDPGVRAAVAAVLGGVAFEASGALKLIERLLQDPDLRVGTAALRALRSMVRQLKEGKRKPNYRVAWSSLQQSLSDLIARADGSTAELAVDVAGRLGSVAATTASGWASWALGARCGGQRGGPTRRAQAGLASSRGGAARQRAGAAAGGQVGAGTLQRTAGQGRGSVARQWPRGCGSRRARGGFRGSRACLGGGYRAGGEDLGEDCLGPK